MRPRTHPTWASCCRRVKRDAAGWLPWTPVPARMIGVVVCVLVALGLTACGPGSAVDPRGDRKDPVALAAVLPTPAGLTETEPARPATPAALAAALVGGPDPAIAQRLRARGLRTAAVRRWSGPGGAALVVATSVWPSHVTATSVGAQAAERLLARTGAVAWTPSGVPGARGARRPGQQRTLAFAVGPNSLFVRAAGPVDDATVARALGRLRLVAEGDAASP